MIRCCKRTHKRTCGFTLVEVLVALAIVGLALPALLFFVNGVTEDTAYLRDKAIAQWIASDRMAEAQVNRRLTGAVLRGENSGETEMADSRWRWRITSTESPVPGLRQLKVEVFHHSQNIKSDALVTLVGLVEE